MNLHEYQAKALLASYAIPVPKGQAADSPDQAFEHALSLGGNTLMVKA